LERGEDQRLPQPTQEENANQNQGSGRKKEGIHGMFSEVELTGLGVLLYGRKG
jgi:hypothetical protein